MYYDSLCNAEVINLSTCHKLGYVSNFLFDCHSGTIQSLIVPGPCKFFGLLPGSSEYVIPYCRIKQIGCDIILVDICEEEALKERHH